MKVDAVVIMALSPVGFTELAKFKGFEWERLYIYDNLPSPEDLKGKVVLAQGGMPLELAAAAYRIVNIKHDGSIEVFQHTVEYTSWDYALCDHCETFSGEEETYSAGIGCTYSEGWRCTECRRSVFA